MEAGEQQELVASSKDHHQERSSLPKINHHKEKNKYLAMVKSKDHHQGNMRIPIAQTLILHNTIKREEMNLKMTTLNKRFINKMFTNNPEANHHNMRINSKCMWDKVWEVEQEVVGILNIKGHKLQR